MGRRNARGRGGFRGNLDNLSGCDLQRSHDIQLGPEQTPSRPPSFTGHPGDRE